MEKKTSSKKIASQPLSPLAHWVMAGVAFGLSYLAISHAIDTGSLLEYAVSIVLFGLAVSHLVRGVKAGAQ